MAQPETPPPVPWPWRSDRPRPIHRGRIRFIEIPADVRAEIEARELARRAALFAPGRAGPDPDGDDQADEHKPRDG